MAFTAAQRLDVARQFVRKAYRDADATANLDTDDIDAAIAVESTAIDNNQATLNNLLPEPFKGNATAQQKKLSWAFAFMKEAGLI